jgi:hypothetical protein
MLLTAPALVALISVAHAKDTKDYHDFFRMLGISMQGNVACHDGMATSLDAMEASTGYDPAYWQFRHAHPDLTHKWAMEGVQSYIAAHGNKCVTD